MIYLQKFLPILFFPITIIALFLISAIWSKKRALIIFALSFLLITSLPIVSKNLQHLIEYPATRQDLNAIKSADAIVVLGGFISRVQSSNGPVLEWGRAARFFAGIDLIESNKAPYLIFTNEKLPWMPDTVPVGQYLSKYATKMGVNSRQILITSNVQNTEEEALAVGELAKQYGLRKIILVTSAFHMQRASQQFEAHGFKVIPYPVDFSSNADQINVLDFIPNAGAMASTEDALKEFLARAYYRLRNLIKG